MTGARIGRPIVRTRDTLSGSPRIDGTRLYVSLFVIRAMNGGRRFGTDEQIMADYPQVTKGDLRSCWEYAARCPHTIARELAYVGAAPIDMNVPGKFLRKAARRMIATLERETAAVFAPEVRAWALRRLGRR